MSVTDRILSALTTVIRMNDKVEEMAALMRQQQQRIDDLNGRVIRLETVLELALSQNRATTGGPPQLPEGTATPQRPSTT